jgi:integrase/recombinase XerD
MKTDHILAEWRAWQQAQGLSDRTITERAGVVRHLLAGSDPLELTPAAIIMFCGRREISANSRGTYHASIRAYCAWLVRTGRRTDDPTAQTPVPRRTRSQPKPVATSDLGILLATVNRRRTRMMILLGAAAGLRVHEIAKFHGYDIDRTNGIITVTGKGGSTEMIAAHDDILAAAADFPRDDYWFPAYGQGEHGGQHVTGTSVSQTLGRVMTRAGVRGTPHHLRHWYGTGLLASGTDVRVVQLMMRHHQLSSTAIYTEVSMAQQLAAIGRLELPWAA